MDSISSANRFKATFVFITLALVCVAAWLQPAACLAQQQDILLPPARTDGGMPLMKALRERHTERAFSQKDLPLQALSDLLWAAFGVNRAKTNGRTAPSAMNWQEIDLFVATKQGLYRYDAPTHSLKLVLAEDIRAATGIQPMAKEAPLSIVFVADYAKMKQVTSKEDKILYSAADAGFISQNIYLFCASEGLATGVRGLIDRTALAKVMALRPDQKIILAQSVGYPKEK